MGKVKCNKNGLSTFIKNVEELLNEYSALYASAVAEVETLNDRAISGVKNSLSVTPKMIIINEGTPDERAEPNEKYDYLENELSKADLNSIRISDMKATKGKIEKILSVIISGLKKIEKSVSKFESETGDVEFTVEAKKKVVVNNATGISVTQLLFTVTNPDGTVVEYTMSELLNAFYTMQGMEMNSVYQAALLADELGLNELTDEDLLHILQTSKSVVNFAFDLGLYDVASKDDLENYKKNLKDAGFTVSADASSLLKSVNFYDDDTRKKAVNYLNKATNAAIFGGAFSAAVTSLYGLYNNDSEIVKKEEKKESSTGPSGSPSYPGGNNGGNNGASYGSGSSGGHGEGGKSSSHAKKTHASKAKGRSTIKNLEPLDLDYIDDNLSVDDIVEELMVPGMAKPIEAVTGTLEKLVDTAELPADYIVIELEKDYDDLARQEYEAQGVEAIETHRKELYALANELYNADDKTALRQKLKEFGYSDADIEIIITDVNLTTNAIISGDLRKELAERAQNLAKADGVEEFNTLYDDAQSLALLQDGSVDKLLVILSSNPDIKAAQDNLALVGATYSNSIEGANVALGELAKAKEELVKVQESIGVIIKSEPAQWNKEILDAYNEEVKNLYSAKVNEIGNDFTKWSADDLETYQKALDNAKNSLAYNYGVDKTKWSAEAKTKYDNSINSLQSKYEKEYGKDHSKWSDSVVSSYEKNKDGIYHNIALEVGKSRLTPEDEKKVAEAAQSTRDRIVAKYGDQRNWSEEQKKAYEESVNALKEKYAENIAVDIDKSSLTQNQLDDYNKAVLAYNAAAEKAKEAVANSDKAKEEYVKAQKTLTDAKEKFFAELAADKAASQNNQGPIGIQTLGDETGDLIIGGGVSVTPTGGSISADGGEQAINNGGTIINDDEVPRQEAISNNETGERIVSDDKIIDYGIPIQEISNGDIK